MRTASIVIAVLLGLASAENILSVQQQAKKARLEREINELVNEIKSTGDELKEFAQENKAAHIQHRADMTKKVEGLVHESDLVNQDYDMAIRNVVQSADVTHTQHGLPQISFGSPVQKASIAQKFETAINADGQNGEHWAQAIESQ